MGDAADVSTAPSRRALFGALSIFIAALGLRWVALSQIEASYPLADRVVIDEASYERWALEIVGGDWIGDEVFFQEPLYPYWIAVVYGVLGTERAGLRVVQAVLGALVAAGVFGLGRRLFGPLAGWVAGLAVAFDRALLFLPALLLKPNLFLPVLVVLAWLLAIGFEGSRPRARAFAVGVAAGLGALLRGNMVLLLPILVLWPAAAVHRRRGPRSAAVLSGLVVAGCLAILGPVALRNHAVGGVFTLTTSGAGTNVYGGNNLDNPYGRATEFDWVRGIPEYEAGDWAHEAERRTGRELDPGEVSSFWLGEALRSVAAAPGAHLTILWNKARLTLGAFEVPDNHGLDWAARYVPILSPLFPGRALWGTLGLAGLVWFGLQRRWGERLSAGEDSREGASKEGAGAVALLWLLYFATIVATVTSMRARLPLVPLMAPFAGLLVRDLAAWSRLGLRDRGRLVGVVVVASVAVLWPVLDASQRADELDKRDYNLVTYLLEDPGEIERAELLARELLERHPNTSRLRSLVAEIEARRGFALRSSDPGAAEVLVESAVARLTSVLENDGTNARERYRANALAGGIKLDAGDPRGAIGHLRAALAFDPDDRELRLRLAQALDLSGDRAAAIAELERILSSGPDAEAERILAALGG